MALSRSGSQTGENPTITAIAIDRDKNSQHAVRWAVENLLNKANPVCILIHVRSQSLHPHDFDAVPKEGRPPTEQELQHFFLPYRGFCARKGIDAKEVVLHDIDIPSALADYAINNSISNIVVGASSRNAITRKFKRLDVPTNLLNCAPETCSVYVVSSKEKVQTSRLAIQNSTSTSSTPKKQKSQPQSPAAKSFSRQHTQILEDILPDPDADVISRSSSGSWKSDGSSRVSSDKSCDSVQMSPYNKTRFSYKANWSPSSSNNVSSDVLYGNSPSDISDVSGPLSFQSTEGASVISGSSKSSVISTPIDYEAEMSRLRMELKQSLEMYNLACEEARLVKQKSTHHQQSKTAQVHKLEETKLAQGTALSLAEEEKPKTKNVAEVAWMGQKLAEMEVLKKKIVEMKIQHGVEESKKAMESFAGVQYRKYTINEIEVATKYFDTSMKIGEGGYGPVFKGMLNCAAVAVKVLRPDLSQGQKQFRQEVEVLSKMRHPNMVILQGACPEYGCLVYEYMENGSLEDRLFRKGNTPPIPWRTRFKIAAEIGTALLFLHQTKPEPLVHRDLKPANILLDKNYVSKIADVGLARLVPPPIADSATHYHMTAAAGTFCYIDPEYQQTGLLGVKSDLYSLGVVLLQLITAKPPIGLTSQFEEAINHGTFSDILDPTVIDWPVQEALSLAQLALKCCELRKRDRPDLAKVVLPELNRLRDLGLDNTANDRIGHLPKPRHCKSFSREAAPTVQDEMAYRSFM